MASAHPSPTGLTAQSPVWVLSQGLGPFSQQTSRKFEMGIRDHASFALDRAESKSTEEQGTALGLTKSMKGSPETFSAGQLRTRFSGKKLCLDISEHKVPRGRKNLHNHGLQRHVIAG